MSAPILDIRGLTVGIRRPGEAPLEIVRDLSFDIMPGEVFGLVGRSLVMGRDMRLSGPRMCAAFVEAVLDAGADVVDVGLSSTDELWFASGHLGLPGAMFTASHNPGAYNGVKFCHPGARPIDPAELVAIARRAQAGPVPPAPLRGRSRYTIGA